MRGYPQWRWHLDEVFVKVNGKLCFLWRAVDHEGEALEGPASVGADRGAGPASEKSKRGEGTLAGEAFSIPSGSHVFPRLTVAIRATRDFRAAQNHLRRSSLRLHGSRLRPHYNRARLPD